MPIKKHRHFHFTPHPEEDNNCRNVGIIININEMYKQARPPTRSRMSLRKKRTKEVESGTTKNKPDGAMLFPPISTCGDP